LASAHRWRKITPKDCALFDSASQPPDGRYARKALAASVAGYAMDGFDMLILGFMLPEISAELHLTAAQAGSLVTSRICWSQHSCSQRRKVWNCSKGSVRQTGNPGTCTR
jgi:hypothetical protein